MLAALDELIPWRERAFVTVAEAAQIVARSTCWVRDRIGEGRLAAARLTPGGPAVVCVPSLLLLIDGAIPVAAGDAIKAAQKRGRSRPRLVVSNP